MHVYGAYRPVRPSRLPPDPLYYDDHGSGGALARPRQVIIFQALRSTDIGLEFLAGAYRTQLALDI